MYSWDKQNDHVRAFIAHTNKSNAFSIHAGADEMPAFNCLRGKVCFRD